MITPVRHWLRAASSGEFFTRWSWLLTLPFAVTVMGGYDQAVTPGERLTGFVIALVVHGLAGAVGVLAAVGERAATSGRVRIGIVVGAVTVIAVGRPVALAGAAAASGLTLFTGTLVGRVLTNLVVDTIALSIVAMLTVSVRTHRSAAQRLRTVLGALEEQRSRDAADVAELTAGVLRTTRAAVIEALPSASARPLDPEQGARALQRFADEVVRPVSHHLFDETTPRDGPALHDSPSAERIEPPPRSLSVRSEAGDLIGDLRAAPVWLTAVAYAVLWIPYVVARAPGIVTVTAMIAAILIGAAGNRVVQGVTRTVTRPLLRLGALAGGYAVVGAIVGAAAGVVFTSADQGGPRGDLVVDIAQGALIYPVVAILTSVARAGLDRLAVTEAGLAAAVDAANTAAASAHNKLLVARRRVARLLHGDVQAECARAVRSLRTSGTLTEEDWAAILRRIEGHLDRDWGGPAPDEARQTVEKMLEAWRYSMVVTVDATDAAWASLDADAARLELAVDILSEGLTNAIRHGTGLWGEVTIRSSDPAPGVEIDVVSPGVLEARPVGDGYGLAQLASRARHLSLTESGSAVRLHVEFA